MKLGIDLRVLTRGRHTGIEEYTVNLLNHLLPLASQLEIELFYNAYRKKELKHAWLSLPYLQLKDYRIPNRLLFFLARYFNQPKIDKLLNQPELYFNPHFFNAPLSRDCQKVTTFHDLAFIHYPQFFSWRKRFWQRFLICAQREARQSDKIIAVSRSTAQDLINFFQIEPAKIEVIYSGVSPQFRVINSQSPLEGKVKRKYNLPKQFILYFGTIEPRKNLIGLIKAFELFKKKNSQSAQGVKLVIAGGPGWLCQEIFQTARRSPVASEILFTGFVQEEDKVYLYNLARLFVYPSFFEGFGFPPLEAMACGLPVIVSHSSSLPEIAGRAALMVDPFQIDEIAWAMELAFFDQGLRKDLAEAGLKQVKQFSWPVCAQKTLRVFLKLLKK